MYAMRMTADVVIKFNGVETWLQGRRLSLGGGEGELFIYKILSGRIYYNKYCFSNSVFQLDALKLESRLLI